MPILPCVRCCQRIKKDGRAAELARQMTKLASFGIILIYLNWGSYPRAHVRFAQRFTFDYPLDTLRKKENESWGSKGRQGKAEASAAESSAHLSQRIAAAPSGPPLVRLVSTNCSAYTLPTKSDDNKRARSQRCCRQQRCLMLTHLYTTLYH